MKTGDVHIKNPGRDWDEFGIAQPSGIGSVPIKARLRMTSHPPSWLFFSVGKRCLQIADHPVCFRAGFENLL